MSLPFVAEIRMFPTNFAPNGWAFCNGQIISIAQNTALFSLLGTTYGGNGQTTFALPNLQGRMAVGTGQGPGLSNYVLGQTAGNSTHTLISTEMPVHTHTLGANNGDGTLPTPSANIPAGPGADRDLYLYAPPGALTNMNSNAVAIAGGSQPHENMQPYLVVNYCIAMNGIFPARN